MKKLIYVLVAIPLITIFLSTAQAEELKPKDEIVTLNIFERITIPNVLPLKQSYVKGLVIKDINEKVRLTPEEIEKYEVMPAQPQGLTWNDPDYTIEVSFTSLESSILKDAFRKLDEKKEVPTTDRFLDLYKKIKELK